VSEADGWDGNVSSRFASVIRGNMQGRIVRSPLLKATALIIVVAAGVAAALVIKAPYAEVATPTRDAFPQDLINEGARLSAIGNCETCHTTTPTARFAGGFPLPTPFGVIHSTNISPDRETGIGTWSEEAFRRSMREGVARDGTHLYPAFPYDHFAKLTDGDIKALYAYVMTRDPVRAERPANDLKFPYNIRPLLAGWKLLYASSKPYEPNPSKSAEWNRGAYLVEGVGHCGACHTPRNSLGAERSDDRFGGGEAEGWHAPALSAKSPAPIPWDIDHLVLYLREGFDGQHGAPAGPMAPVVRNLARVPLDDAKAIAAYIKDIAGPPSAERKATADALLAKVMASPISERSGTSTGQVSNGKGSSGKGEDIYWATCAQCHEPSGQGVPFALSTTFSQPSPYNVLHIIAHGIRPPGGQPGPIMPSFSGALTDAQIVALVTFMRQAFSTQPAWTNIEDQLRQIRREDQSLTSVIARTPGSP
jgi:mono/diheme cytochrome c family protein